MVKSWQKTILIVLAAVSPAVSQPQEIRRQVFPLLIDGVSPDGVYRSILKIERVGTGSVPCTLEQFGTEASFTGLSGDRYVPDVFAVGTALQAVTSLTLDALKPWEILRTTADLPVRTGYAALECLGSVRTELQLTLRGEANVKLSETVLAPAVAGGAFEFLVDERGGVRFMFTLVNDGPSAGWYTLIVRDEYGLEIGRVDDVLDPRSHLSAFVDDLLDLPSSFVGKVVLQGPGSGSVYATGVQFEGLLFTALPPVVVGGGGED